MNQELTFVTGSSRGRVGILAVMAFVGLMMATVAEISETAPAGALTQDVTSEGNCSAGGLRYQYTGGGWTGGAPPNNWDVRPTLRTYANGWEVEREYSNWGPVVDIIEASGEIDVFWVAPAVVGNDLARASCNNGRIRISTANAPPVAGPSNAWYADMGRVFQHELGHTMGMWHTGLSDSDDLVRPIMSTCQSFAQSSLRNLSQDDFQQLQRLNGDLNPETMSANIGFNRGTEFYKKTSGSFWYTYNNRLRFRRSTPTSDQKFSQRTAVAGSAGNSYDVRINWARPYAGQAGMVWASVYARTLTYASDTCTPNPGSVAGHSMTGTVTDGGDWWFKGDLGG